MSIIIKLYGDLRIKTSHLNNDPALPSTLNIQADNIKTVMDVLNKFSINQDEISHIFVNGKYSKPVNEVRNGDRIGIFPRRMGLIFVELKFPF